MAQPSSTLTPTKSTQSSPPLYVPALDGMRGYAAVLIIVYHCWVLTGSADLHFDAGRNFLSVGFSAVSMFFVLSGFVLFLPTAAKSGSQGSKRAYLAKRAARILPAYYLSIAFALLLFPLLLGNGSFDGITKSSLLSHLTLTQGTARVIPGYSGALGFSVNPVVWTLSVEVIFYLMLPLIASRYFRHPFLWLLGAFALSIGSRLFLDANPLAFSEKIDSAAFSLFPLYATDFAVGMTAAWCFARFEQLTIRETLAKLLPILAGAAGLALAIVLVIVGGDDGGTVYRDVRRSTMAMILIPSLFGVFALAVSLSHQRMQWLFINRVARFLGEISYGAFLFHFIVITFALHALDFSHDGTNLAFAKMTAFVLPISLGLGWLSHRFVERPARLFVRQRLAVSS